MSVKFSILTPVYKPEPDHLRECIASVKAQTSSDFEHILVADGPQPPEITKILSKLKAPFKVIFNKQNGGISAATNTALQAATGEFIALLDNDDTLAPHALGTMAWELDRIGGVDLAFSDEDHLAHDTGARRDPYFKPGFSMARLRQQMYLGHLLVIRRELALHVGGFRSEMDGSQDHDIALRVAEQARRVIHVPQILYHWRESPTSTALNIDSKSWAYDAGVRAVADHLRRTNFPATARKGDIFGVAEIEPKLEIEPLVSIVIPTGFSTRIVRGERRVLVDLAVQSILDNSSYTNFEVIVVVDAKSDIQDAEYLKELDPAGRVKLVKDTREFNFSKACNLGSASSSGHFLIFHNDDTEIVQSNWIERMVMYASRPEIGAVGIKLLYGDGTINHAGVWAKNGEIGHRYRDASPDSPGKAQSLNLATSCLAVTGACLAVTRKKFEEVGGFTEELPLAFNDIDLCFKLTKAGYGSVVDCATTVLHHESSSRDPKVVEYEVKFIHERWKPLLYIDPYMNPNYRAEGFEEYPEPSMEMVEYLERSGEANFQARAWPAEQDYMAVARS